MGIAVNAKALVKLEVTRANSPVINGQLLCAHLVKSQSAWR
jgi:hypothetical protein